MIGNLLFSILGYAKKGKDGLVESGKEFTEAIDGLYISDFLNKGRCQLDGDCLLFFLLASVSKAAHCHGFLIKVSCLYNLIKHHMRPCPILNSMF